MIIQKATVKDLREIVQVHIKCFPNSFSSQIGSKLLENYYFEYLSMNPDLFLIAVENNNIVGFCMGYLCENTGFSKRFIKKNFASLGCKVIFLIFKKNNLAKEKMKSIIKRSNQGKVYSTEYDDITADNSGDLLSICVLQEYRGTGIAMSLIVEYEERLSELNRRVCYLSVLSNNDRAMAFYEKNGYEKVKRTNDTIKMAKMLQEYK